MTDYKKPSITSEDAGTLSTLIAHARLQDSLLQSYRQIYLGLQAVLQAIGIGVAAALTTMNPGGRRTVMFWFLVLIAALAVSCVTKLRNIVLARARDVTYWHSAILNYEALQPPETRFFTEFKISQEPAEAQSSLRKVYLSDGEPPSTFEELVDVTPGHTRRVLESQLFYGAGLVWLALVLFGAWLTYR